MRIMLACTMGLSTSLVVTKMQLVAKEQGKEDYKIWAVDQGEIEKEMGKFDVLLLGPQLRHLVKKVKKMVGEDFPCAVIIPEAYGTCDGAAVIKQAEALYREKQK